MIFDHTVHAEPRPGETVSPCCGLTLPELPRADWLTRNPSEVTCDTLTDRDIELLLGGPPDNSSTGEVDPPTTEPATDQFIFELTTRIRATCRSRGHCTYRAPATPGWH